MPHFQVIRVNGQIPWACSRLAGRIAKALEPFRNGTKVEKPKSWPMAFPSSKCSFVLPVLHEGLRVVAQTYVQTTNLHQPSVSRMPFRTAVVKVSRVYNKIVAKLQIES